MQYIFTADEHEVKVSKAHGNSKGNRAYRRTFPSTRQLLQSSLKEKDAPKFGLDKIFKSVGDVTEARSLGQLPRGPSDIYNARHAAKKLDRDEHSGSAKGKFDSLWMMLERAKREEVTERFIRECNIHPNLTVVLASDRQLQELKQFCTDPTAFSILGVDPTFNIFEENISLTVTSYRNLR